MSKPTILCATDLSADGARALDLAAALARTLDGTITLLYATDTAETAEADVPESMAEGAEALKARVRERLDREAAALEEERRRCESLGVECDAKLVGGRPAEAIEREAAELGAGLVVLGRRGDREEGYVGPTIHRVVRHAPCPVAVASPDDAAPESLKGGRWVIGADFSRPARAALAAAQALVRASGGEIVLAHVVSPPGGEGLPYEQRSPQQILREEGNKEQARRMSALAAELDVSARAVQRVALERPADELRALADEVDATGIIVGTHGRTGLGRFFVGSTADRLLQKARRPVLVVREPPPHVAPWFPVPAGEPLPLSPTHLLVAVDFSEPSRRALELARALAASLDLAVDVLHVHEPVTDVRRGLVGRLAAGSAASELDANARARARKELSSLVGEVFGDDAPAVSLHVEAGRPAERIAGVARAIGADLIALGTTGRTGLERMLLGSVAEALVRQSSVPVLTVP